MIYFRTDANKKIATGHVMRCLTIAEAIVELGGQVCFIVSDEESTMLIKEYKFPVIVTYSNWNNVDIMYEYDLLCAYFEKKDILCVDSYFLHSDYLSQMGKKVKVATFDDMFSEKKKADIIINYNIFYRKFDYEKRYENDKCKLLLGEKYVPLRKQFTLIKTNAYDIDQVKILLMCGGSDEKNMIYHSLQKVKEKDYDLFQKIKWKVVIGGYYPYKKMLGRFASQNCNMEILTNIKNMAQLMSICDLCVTAASTVLYECCAMRLPTLFMTVAEDQKYDAEYFSKDGMMEYCGDFINNQEGTLENMCSMLEELVINNDKRQRMKSQMKNLVDGYGAKRIAQVLMEE